MDLKELESGVDPIIHWYYQTKKLPLISFVKKIYSRKKSPLTLIDVGSGSGFFMYELRKSIPEMISKIWLVDVGYSDTEIAESRGSLIEKSTTLPDRIENSVIVMMDVLEHLEDDQAMLSGIKERSTGENYFFITVPAFRELWSRHDVFLCHFRRYTLKSLKKLLAQSSFKTYNTYYFYGLILPFVWLVRRFQSKSDPPSSDMKPAGSFINTSLTAICRIEVPFRKLNHAGGVSCVAEGSL